MKRVIFFMICLSAASFLSCKKDFLELIPYDKVPTDLAIKSEGDVQAATNGIYTQIRAAALYGRDQILRGDLLSDNVYISSVNSNRFLEYYQLNYIVSTVSVSDVWTAAFNAILRANNVINSNLETNTNLNQYKGEALALRALMYFELVRLFGKPYTVDPNALGVPLVLTYDPALKPQRNTVKQVYDQIEKDLTDAIPLLTDRTPYNASYISKNATKALLARVYLHKADWPKALASALDVINTGGYSVLTTANYATYWSNVSPRTDKVESLFELNFDATGNAGLNSLVYFYAQSGYGDALATDDLYNSYTNTDVRKAVILDGTRGGRSAKIVNKYPNNANTNKDDMKILRLSEVYLTAAEASYQTNNFPQALTYLNYVATRRDPSFTGYASTGTQILEDILTERRKELAFEGHRYWDLVRYNRDVVRVNVNANYPGNVPLTLDVSNFRRILPVPQSELDANPNIKTQQNSGY